MKEVIAQAIDLTIGYDLPQRSETVVAKGLNLDLRAGELVCLIGPNGVGKSTLLRTLAGMQPLLWGEIRLMGDDLHSLRVREIARRLSIVLTERVDAGLLTASALVGLGRYPYTGWAGRFSPKDEEIVRWAIDVVGAGALANRLAAELSDGERQKIMIARALAQEPALMLLDEPTAYLDLPRRVEIMGLLRQLAHSTGRSILLSTHDLDLALRTADLIWLMSPGGGLHVGAPEDLILNGAFQETFRSEGVTFDPTSGSFEIEARTNGRIAVEGDGLPAIWTRRALIRSGHTIAGENEPAPARVDVIAENGNVRWRVRSGGEVKEYRTVREMISDLRRRAAS
ncbi:MAG: ABC transporter ATP-binding protein [Anaerolineae bacterium]|nr:ABC transporter ATP-binding protein [Anaerolineae bacterium]